MLRINDGLKIEDWELIENFSRSSGPGGQHVNKVSTAVELRFDAKNSPGLNDEIRIRLQSVAGRRWTTDGFVVIHVEDTRSQARNRQIAKNRLVDLIRRAATPPKKRKPTQIPTGERKKRLEEKKIRGGVKSLRGKVDQFD
ncbi:MAG: alternative ribosome rescue aminoacyl-tRNA hydrolase ArfB [Roseovarius sp.]|nr:alternative ribosome rescue aminoacyl-tRNA hydrolase ArfB [Roseovarius sp.]MCY4207240.1 alternative ribosome rescue aminoacyl-tRNA hydrolase ArfB [Roseovarius sp.]MCY4292364.1 alternative ribosome rescue aminoacyl-tRNA hydrolase ArfB [Roseovarius sp.]MCY4315905.1 alternative ribosome rescue aminoacyl-tRNA hydrolase ArfB [Roseovarius sp.]